MRANACIPLRPTMLVSICTLLLLLLPSRVAHGIQVRGPFTQVHDVVPGETTQAVLTLYNGRTTPERVRIYVTDYVHDVGRGWLFPPAGTLPRSNAHWIAWTDTELVLQPGEERSIPYEISVPPGDAEGTYWSSFMIEPQSVQNVLFMESEDRAESTAVALRQGFRYQVAVITNVGSTGERMVTFHNPTLVKTSGGDNVFQIVVQNAGERWLQPHISLAVYDETGHVVHRASAGRPHLLPGTARAVDFSLANLAPGEYVALLFVDDGADDVLGTRVTIRVQQQTQQRGEVHR